MSFDDQDAAEALREHHRQGGTRHYQPEWDDEPEDDGGGNEGPSFESSMRAKFPVQFNDRRSLRRAASGRRQSQMRNPSVPQDSNGTGLTAL
jgi:hypothetical protein